MKIKRLFKDIESVLIRGSKEQEITGITANSKLVAPGNLFVAKKGLTHDGTKFIPEALSSGAVAILTDIYDPFLTEVVQIIHPDVAAIEADVAATYYQHPSDALDIVGITGTNGKTTTSYLVKHLLDGVQRPCGLIGTIEWIVGKNHLPSLMTTADVITNHRLFHEMVANDCQAAVMEVSSHALDQSRVGRIDFDVAIYTNLTQDHLDYHQTMEKYAEAKAKLFSSLSLSSHAVINIDCPWSGLMIKSSRAPVLTYGIDNPADLFATEIRLSPKGMRFIVNYHDKKLAFASALIGRFNVYNLLAAIGAGLSLNISLEKCVEILQKFKRVPGRLERVMNARALNIFVDYAHTPDALKNVLETLREIKKGRIITVFGCGGNRDQGKRPKMGAVAEALSDICIVTSDNPRSEEPQEILNQILSGFKNPKAPLVCLDRKEAILSAIKMADADDLVLIAGKGHETYQIFAHQTLHFDDRVVAKESVDLAQSC